MTLRIAVLFNGGISRALGTPERVLQIAQELADQGVNVTLAAIRCHASVKISRNLRVIAMCDKIVTIPSIMRWVAKLIANSLVHKYDIVQIESFGYRSLILFFLLRPFNRKFVVVFHDLPSMRDPRESMTALFHIFLQRIILTLFDAAIAPGANMKKSLQEFHGKIVNDRVTVIPNGVPRLDDSKIIDCVHARRKYGLDTNAFLALFFGSMTFAPNYQAAQVLYGISGFVSSQFEENTCKKLIFATAGKGSEVLPKTDWFVPIGFVKDIYELFSLPDAIVLPHPPSCTGPHVKTNYAFASGKPVVATEDSVKDMPHVAVQRHYLLFDINEPNTLLKALLDLYSNEELRKSLTRNAYSYSRQFSWKNAALSHLELYDRLLSHVSRILT